MKKLIKKLYRYSTLRVLFPLQYKKYSKKPVKKNKAVFIESQLPVLSNSLEVMYVALTERNWEVSVHCLRESFVGKFTFLKLAMDCIKDLADAEYIFLCDANRMIGCLPLRKETAVTQLWHACGAFKKFGMSTSELKFGGSREDYLRYPYYGNLDYVTVSSPEIIWAYREAMNLENASTEVVATGISRTDTFFNKKFLDAARQHVLDVFPQATNKKILLYAPTFRGEVSTAKAPDQLNIAAMANVLKEEYVLLIKHHPVAGNRPVIPEELKDFAADVTDSLSIDDLLCVSDLCISDYSSLIFEYSLFERPMLFFAYDLEEYYDERGFYYDYNDLTPGPVVRTTEEIIDYIQHLGTRFDRQKVAAFREKFMSACDGHATERILELLANRRK